jgi:hypothetical protein
MDAMDNFDDAQSIIDAVKNNIEHDRIWVIQRLVRHQKQGGEEVYETLSDYRPMHIDDLLDALRDAEWRYPHDVLRCTKLMSDAP